MVVTSEAHVKVPLPDFMCWHRQSDAEFVIPCISRPYDHKTQSVWHRLVR